jgi:hypothetical protein
MKEKINAYPIDRPITAARRQKIDRFIQGQAGRLGDRPFSHGWSESGAVLRLESSPVEWEFVFYPDRVEAFGSAPFWVKMLFNAKRRAAADEIIFQMLEEAGFYAQDPPAGAKKPVPKNKAT